MEIVLFWLLFAVIVGVVASSRDRSGFGWFLLSLVITPLLGLILVLALGRPQVDPATDGLHKKCPMCAEWVKKAAVKCRYCGASLTAVATPAGIPNGPNEAELKDALERERAAVLDKITLRSRRRRAESVGRAAGSFFADSPILALLLAAIVLAAAYAIFWH